MDYPFELPPSTGAVTTREVFTVETVIVHLKYETGSHYSRTSTEHTKLARPGVFTGGAWHPDSPRIGVSGILSGSALKNGSR
jgi:hypothetical protein